MKKIFGILSIFPTLAYSNIDANLHIGQLNSLEANKQVLNTQIGFNEEIKEYISQEKRKTRYSKTNHFTPNFAKNIYAFNTFVLCTDLGNLISLESGNTKLFDRKKCFYAIRGSLIRIMDAYEGNPYIKLRLFYNGNKIDAYTRKDLFHNGTNCKPTKYALKITENPDKSKLN